MYIAASHTRKKFRVSKDNSDSSTESDNEDYEQKVALNKSKCFLINKML